MKYQETGRFGRITKNLRNLGFESEMEKILYDSNEFPRLKKLEQTKYIESIMNRLVDTLGQENTDAVLFACGEQCCGKSWSKFAEKIWKESSSVEDFFMNLNKEEEKYETSISYDSIRNTITVIRNKCICGLINKGKYFNNNKSFCNCSLGHMSVFFNSVFTVQDILLERSIFNGDEKCEWIIKLAE